MSKKPWEELPSVWKTESAFWTWCKGVIRHGWNFHPIKLEYIKRHRVMITNPNLKGKKKEVWGGKCEICGNLFTAGQMHVDHKSEETAKLVKQEDIQDCFEKLMLVVFDDIRWICKECHLTHSVAQKQGISFEEAKQYQKVIAFKKLKATEQKEMLLQYGVDGSNMNSTCRVEEYRKIIEKENML